MTDLVNVRQHQRLVYNPRGMMGSTLATGKSHSTKKYATVKDGNVVRLYHYGTLILAWDLQNGKPVETNQYGGYSVSDQGAINKTLGELPGGSDYYASRKGGELKITKGGQPVESKGEKPEGSGGYHKTDGWRGYEYPAFAVAGASDTGMWSDSPAPSDKVDAELKEAQAKLRAAGIKSRIDTKQSSNVFMVKRWITVNPDQVKKAKQVLGDVEKDHSYLHGPG